MTHNYQAESWLEERSATAEKSDDDAHRSYQNEQIFRWKAKVVGIKCRIALVGEVQPKSQGQKKAAA